jgi:hypothetical protein
MAARGACLRASRPQQKAACSGPAPLIQALRNISDMKTRSLCDITTRAQPTKPLRHADGTQVLGRAAWSDVGVGSLFDTTGQLDGL